MPSGDQRHAQLVRLFRGDFGENLFTNVGLRGPAGGKSELCSYLALYPNGDTPYARVIKASITKEEATAQLRKFVFPEESARAEAKGARAVVAGPIDMVDETLWQLGRRQVQPYGLPVIFLTWMRLVEGNRPKVTLWYPTMTQGRWAFTRLKRSVLQ